MKGLASICPTSAKVKISERCARKHYGTNCGVRYVQEEHGDAKKIWDPCFGFYRTYRMEWFIEKVSFDKSRAKSRYLDLANVAMIGEFSQRK